MIPGNRLGPYEVTASIGAGGMGQVYRARDTRLGREVAIKVLPAEFTPNADRLRRFEQEARTLAALNHPNVLVIHDTGIHEGAPYLVSELLEGQTLRETLSSDGQLPQERATEYALQIAHGLAAAHAKGIVHRDLKPENLFVTKDGRMKILDFGLAKLRANLKSEIRNVKSDVGMDAPTLAAQTEPGVVLGTVGYMSPEQVRGEETDQRADLFAFGCILYEMLSGQRAFRRETSVETMTAILKEEPPELTGIVANLAPALERIVSRCLEKQPERRFQSASDLAFGLESSLGTVRTLPSGTDRRDSPQAKQVKAWRIALACGVFLVVVLNVLLFLIFGLRFGSPNVDSSTPPSKQAQKSVAVLPFANMSPDKADEYLSDGLTEELINALVKVEGLRVPSRTSAFMFKERKADIRQIGKELNVGMVLEGSVRKAGDKLRVTAQLINVADGYHLWSEQYDRDMKDVFAVQDEIARMIVSKLKGSPSAPATARLVKPSTVNAEAYQLYLKGRYFWNKRSPEGLRQSLEYFQQALDKDPLYALAYAGSADAHLLYALYAGLPLREYAQRSKAAARRALELDGTLAEAYTSLGYAKMVADYDWEGAAADFKTALNLNPHYPTARQWYANYLSWLGRADEALHEARKARDLDPLSRIIRTDIGGHLYFARRYDEAIAEYRQTLDMDNGFVPARLGLAEACIDKGRFDEALRELAKESQASHPQGEIDWAKPALARTYALTGRRNDAEKILTELRELNKPPGRLSYELARIYVALQDHQQALRCLEEAYANPYGQLVWLKMDPAFQPLHAEPRFKELLRKVGLEP